MPLRGDANREHARKGMAAIREERWKAGLCSHCGKRPHLPQRKGCAPCLDEAIARYRASARRKAANGKTA